MAFEHKLAFWLTPGELELLAKGEPPNKYMGHLCAESTDMSEHGWVKMKTITHTIQPEEFPSPDTAIQMVTATLQTEKARILEEARVKAMKIDETLAKIQSLTYAPATAKEPSNDIPL